MAHPQAQVGGGGGQEQVDRIALLAFEEVTAEAVIAFEMVDAWFDRGATTQPPSGFAACVEGFRRLSGAWA